MIKRVKKETVLIMDKAIKNKIEKTGDFTEKDCYVSRVIWNVLFAKTKWERKRSMGLLKDIAKD
jgi:hypothetical protein